MQSFGTILLASLLLGQYCIICSLQEDATFNENVILSEYSNHQNESVQNNTTFKQSLNKVSMVEQLTGDLDENQTKCQDVKHHSLPYEHCDSNDCTMSIGSNDCMEKEDCTNINLLLLIPFAFAGILLVFFIKIFNITVSHGAVHGLIFYANVVWAYESIYLDNSHNNFKFLKVFLAWLNLDFGIKMCLFKDLDFYMKTCLQFVFPLYICLIAALIITLSRCSQRIMRVFGRNSVQVLATLFLLSHAKLLRTIAVAVQPSNLKVPCNENLTNNGTQIYTQTCKQLVWGYDSEMKFIEMKHTILLAVAVTLFCLVWLPFTLTLLFIHPLRCYSQFRLCSIVEKLKPFFEAYTGPFQPRSQFWVGLLCLVKGILLFVYIITNFYNKPQLNSLALVIAVIILLVLLYSTGGLYRDPTNLTFCKYTFKISFLSVLEISFLLNLAAFGIVSICIDYISRFRSQDKACAFYISAMIAFLQLTGIFLWHVWKKVTLCCLSRRRDHYTDLDNNNIETEAANPPTMASIVVGNGTFLRSGDRARIRESILTDGSHNNK